MLPGRFLLIFLFAHFVNLQIQINLYLTDWTNDNNDFQHDCLNIASHVNEESDPRQIISYCMGEWPSKFNITENDLDQKLTFSQLSKLQITTEQLYLWSASIDLIEQYQLYLQQLPYSDQTLLATEVFYNCTLPYFGSKCQYRLDIYDTNHSSINEMIHDYYRYNLYEPIHFTCYIHLECNRGPSPLCLDWTEICDGKVDCLNGGTDEEHCWQLEIHQCNENDEYQCSYGQCISKALYLDNSINPDCLDPSFNLIGEINNVNVLSSFIQEPIFKYEDISCARIHAFPFYSPPILTSSCIPKRQDLLLEAVFSIKPSSITDDECWTASKCILHMPRSFENYCSNFCFSEICEKIIKNKCPDIIFIPAYPILLGHVYLAYNKTRMAYKFLPAAPTHVCYNDQYLDVPNDGKKSFRINNKTCRLYTDSKIGGGGFLETKWEQLYVNPVKRWLQRIITPVYNNSVFCDTSTMYQCMNSSKCISKIRLMDYFIDCYYEDDENPLIFNKTYSLEQLSHPFQCPTTNVYIPLSFVNDNLGCRCRTPGDNYCADQNSDEFYFQKTISFPTICDHHPHLAPQFTEDKNATDETNCDQWPLLHIYNRCDGFWNFLNGSDEVNCDSSSSTLLNCSENNHICVSNETNELMCLPIEKANDGIIDCIGAADEPTICPRNISEDNYPYVFYCGNKDRPRCIKGDNLCDGDFDCIHKEDERVCKSEDLIKPTTYNGICTKNYELYGSNVAKVLCRLFVNNGKRLRKYFTLDQSQNSIEKYTQHLSLSLQINTHPDPSNIKVYQPRCHRGLDLHISLDKKQNLTTNICLCPPSYYGHICQYQNQRISLSLQFRVTFDAIQIPFIIIIVSLIDDSDERIIYSHEQFNYLMVKHCLRKFNFYLLYSTRPKNAMKNYSIHIDFYDKLTLNYRGSIIKAVNYSFLPVHRLAFQLDIPYVHDHTQSCVDKQCINGKCVRYFNDLNNTTFCQCHSGWSGKYCHIKYTCLCSSQSVCIGKLANNRSLCICPVNTMGPRCLIDNQICQRNEICQNGGQCVLVDEYDISKNKFICICSPGFSGDRCEIIRTKLIISFNRNEDLFSFIFIHFIEVKVDNFPIRTTTVKRTRIEQDSITISWSLPFHIVFVECSNKNYHLIIMQKTYQPSLIIKKSLNSSNQCLHINELFNETILNYSFLRRIKYYHLPCQMNLTLLCFYDKQQFCLCQQLDRQRVANCFDFNHNSNVNCTGQNDCENHGECIQENSKCPKYFLCKCPPCYLGTKCQWNTNGFSLSLDAILSYYIHPNILFFEQSRIILISTMLSTIIIIGGLINSILSLITFKTKKTRELGCGIYLLCTSIFTLFLMIIFALKFSILIVSQMGLIQKNLFLKIHCRSIDFLIRFCLTMDQWLTTFVSIERAYIIIKGVNFNKNQIRSIAKRTIIILLILTILTNIHDPIYRDLFDEGVDDENRIWCAVKYPLALQTIDSIMIAFHFVAPFIINLISAIIIIIINVRQQATLHTQQKYGTIVKKQIQLHRNLLIGPCVLSILGISRLIISFASDCMKSIRHSWLFLLGYFISLIPPILTFILFVLPSTVYRQAFRNAMNRFKNMFKRCSLR